MWEANGYQGEPPDGWNRAMTRTEDGVPIQFRRRDDLTPENEYIAP